MKNSQRLFEPNTRPFVFFLIVFAVATLVLKNYYLAAAEGVVILGPVSYTHLDVYKRQLQCFNITYPDVSIAQIILKWK